MRVVFRMETMLSMEKWPFLAAKLVQFQTATNEQPKPKTPDWTGAEIRACCRLASLLGVALVEAAKNVVPVATTAAESVERLRNWASGRCLDADVPGIYSRGEGTRPKSRRSIPRDPSVN